MRETPAEQGNAPPAAAAAFTALLNRHQWPLYAFLRGFVAQDEQARDLTQDVFADAWRATQRAAPPFATLAQANADAAADDDAIRRWLFHTAYCRAISVLRRRRLIRWESLDARDETGATNPRLSAVVADNGQAGAWAESSAESFEERVVEAQALNAALATLAPADVACLLLSVVQGFTTAEIAQVIEATPDAAKKRLTRAKQRLRAAYLAQNEQTIGDQPTQAPDHTATGWQGSHDSKASDVRKERRS